MRAGTRTLLSLDGRWGGRRVTHAERPHLWTARSHSRLGALGYQGRSPAAVSPGIFTLNQQGTGTCAILHAEDFQPVSESAPAQPGEFLLIFCTGLGLVQPEVQSGQITPTAEPLARTVSPPIVNIAGIAADVTFSGLAPGFVGLYQVNVQVPAGVPSGTQEVEVIINNVPGNTVTIAVQ